MKAPLAKELLDREKVGEGIKYREGTAHREENCA
jgi:hypothetical protein